MFATRKPYPSDDGYLEMEVTAISGERIDAVVILGGLLKSNKGVNLPGANLSTASFTEKDREDLIFGLNKGVDLVAISFVRSANDILTVREVIETLTEHSEAVKTPIIAKLERPEALEDLESIMQAADGVMVARGDLGVEMPPATVPVAQKRNHRCANAHGKLVITATQMLNSMIENPVPPGQKPQMSPMRFLMERMRSCFQEKLQLESFQSKVLR